MSRPFGWDLPPGVNVGDLPGNRPEDLEEDAFWTEFDRQREKLGLEVSEEHYDADWFMEAIQIARDIGYNRGYTDGLDEARMEQEPVLGKCPHGVDLDRELCPHGCRV
jgi:hypothetical protein